MVHVQPSLARNHVVGDGIVVAPDGAVQLSGTVMSDLMARFAAMETRLKDYDTTTEVAKVEAPTNNSDGIVTISAQAFMEMNEKILAMEASLQNMDLAREKAAGVTWKSSMQPKHVSDIADKDASKAKATDETSGHMIACPSCAFQFPRPPPLTTYYVVTKGINVGTFDDWADVSPLVTGVSRAIYFKAKSATAAREAYDAAFAKGNVEVLPP
ncbi:hypothetical protein C8J56DRAFT_885560 [Mycena floridula]|nr:hypothetical protein C8J56DRAFT_885560 [Mycena floridula]